MGAPFLVERGIDPSEEGLGPALMMRLLLELPEQGGYFRALAEQPSLAEAVWTTLRELRMAGIESDAVPVEAFESPAKHTEIVALLAAYEAHLESAGPRPTWPPSTRRRWPIPTGARSSRRTAGPSCRTCCGRRSSGGCWTPCPASASGPQALALPGVTVPRRLAAAPAERRAAGCRAQSARLPDGAAVGRDVARLGVPRRRTRSRDRRSLPPHPGGRRAAGHRSRSRAPRTRTSRWSGRRRCGTSGSSPSAGASRPRRPDLAAPLLACVTGSRPTSAPGTCAVCCSRAMSRSTPTPSASRRPRPRGRWPAPKPAGAATRIAWRSAACATTTRRGLPIPNVSDDDRAAAQERAEQTSRVAGVAHRTARRHSGAGRRRPRAAPGRRRRPRVALPRAVGRAEERARYARRLRAARLTCATWRAWARSRARCRRRFASSASACSRCRWRRSVRVPDTSTSAT